MTTQFHLLKSSNTVRLRIPDTTKKMVVDAEYLFEPVVSGHEAFNLVTVGFLADHERLRT
jgi:hypothetical protein